MSQLEPEQDQEQAAQDERNESLRQAWAAAGAAFVAFVTVLLTLIGRIVQALFTLARPGLLVGCVVLAGIGGVKLFVASYTAFGGDVPALIVAALAVIVVPAGLLVLAGDYGIWAVLAASGALSWLAALAIARSPPTLLVASIPVVIGAVFAYFAFQREKEGETDG